MEYFTPLPQDLDELISTSISSNSLNVDAVQSIITALDALKDAVGRSEADEATCKTELLALLAKVNGKSASNFKQWSNSVNKFSKSVDKKFATPIQPLFPPAPSAITPIASTSFLPPPPPASFDSPEAIQALNSTIALHLARIGAFTSLDTFLKESSTTPIDSEVLDKFKQLYSILDQLKMGKCVKASEWINEEGRGLAQSDLAFELRKEEFIRILLEGSDLSSLDHNVDAMEVSTSNLLGSKEQVQRALAYGGTHFREFMIPSRQTIISALLTSPLFMPFSQLITSPYSTLFTEYIPNERGQSVAQTRLVAAFTSVFLETLGVPRDSPLSVVTDIGGGGALAKIQKVRTVMKEKRTEWSAIGELPVEIPLPTSHRYHSIFACPVSKEQGTATNPPMLLPCGHVIAKESLTRLSRGSQTLKCPYCPHVSHPQQAIRVHF